MIELNWLKDDQITVLERGYLDKGETPLQRYQTICDTIEVYCKKMGYKGRVVGIKERFEKYVTNNWVSFATPVLKSFGKLDNLSISCNKSILGDSLDSIYLGVHETGMLAKHGAGTSVNFSNIRPIGSEIATGGKSNSVLDWVELYADMMSKTAQNSQRRGFLTAYLSVDHPEIMDFLDIGTKRMPKDKERFFQTITTGVTLPIGWRDDLKTNPEKRKIFTKVLNTRKEAGFPYIVDLTNANEQRPQVYKDKGMEITTSNICSEIMEYCDLEKTFSCCLSSVNAYWFDEWRHDPDFIFDMNILLDCVIEEYIEQAGDINGFEKAVKFCKEHRAVGLGVIALHSYFQKHGMIFGDLPSTMANRTIYQQISEQSLEASKWMAENWGEPLIMEGTGLRNSTRGAQAPTKTTSYIMGGKVNGFSEGSEPHKFNYGEKKVAKIQVEFKVTELNAILDKYNKNTKAVWDSMITYNGSVQHLDFLTVHEKEVFKTFSEINQSDVIRLASDRQKYIDQGQSVNLMIHPDTAPKDVIKLHLEAFDQGLKALYYQYSINASQKFNQKLLEGCSNCES